MMLVGNKAANGLHKKGVSRWLIMIGMGVAALGNMGLCEIGRAHV